MLRVNRILPDEVPAAFKTWAFSARFGSLCFDAFSNPLIRVSSRRDIMESGSFWWSVLFWWCTRWYSRAEMTWETCDFPREVPSIESNPFRFFCFWYNIVRNSKWKAERNHLLLVELSRATEMQQLLMPSPEKDPGLFDEDPRRPSGPDPV